MSFNPKVSIIIPVYNGSNYLKEAIDSALAQTYKNIEIIVVNDGSNDGGKTEEIAKSYGDKIRYFYKENGGVATALNLGIKESEGEYISWLSHDDLYLPEKIERQIQYLGNTASRKLVLFSDFEALDLRKGSRRICRVGYKGLDKLYSALLLLFSSSIHGCTMFIPRGSFDDVGLFNEELRTTQDYELWFKMVKKGYEFRHIPEVLIRTRWHEEQGTVSMSEIHRKEVEDLYDWAVDLFHEDFKLFSYNQIGEIVKILGKRMFKKPSDHILRFWQEGSSCRVILVYLIKLRLHSKIDQLIPAFIKRTLTF